MVQVRRSKLTYNTESSYRVGTFSCGSESDETNFTQTLYLTRTGRYFLHSVGGKYSRFAIQKDFLEPSPGTRVEPLTVDQAIQFARTYLSPEIAERIRIASDRVLEDKLVHITISLRASTVDALDDICRENKRNKEHLQHRSHLVDAILRDYLFDGKSLY